MQQVVITGLGIVSPAGSDETSFAAAVRDGTCPIHSLPDARVPQGQKAVGAPVHDDGVAEGRAPRMLVRACRTALHNAGLEGTAPLECAVLVGTSLGDMDEAMTRHRRQLVAGGTDDVLTCQPEWLARNLADEFGLVGPRVTLSCACTSGTSALGMALDGIRLGRFRRCLVAAVDSLNDFVLCGFASLWALTPDTPRPFDTARTGMALGETAAAFLLEPADDASARGATVRALLAGYGASGDAVHITAPDRSGKGAARAMAAALTDAGWNPTDVDYLNVHATGSAYNDSMILAALRDVFGDHAGALPVSSVNPCTGHTLGAAGLAEAIATVLAMHGGFVPPTPNLATPEADDLILVRDEPLHRPLHRSLSLTTGFGGANTAVALEIPERSAS